LSAEVVVAGVGQSLQAFEYFVNVAWSRGAAGALYPALCTARLDAMEALSYE